ncbi:hypothetical protein CR513_02113, partial [Mucuna pruriens]
MKALCKVVAFRHGQLRKGFSRLGNRPPPLAHQMKGASLSVSGREDKTSTTVGERLEEEHSDQVRWSSPSNQLRRLLLWPFRESYKIFKDQFFRVLYDSIGPDLLVDSIGEPYFLLSWTKKPIEVIEVHSSSSKEETASPKVASGDAALPTTGD